MAVYSSGAVGRLWRWRFCVESPVTTKFYNCPADQLQNIKLKNYLLSPGIEPTISISRDSHIDHSSTLAQVIVGISCIYVWTTTALKDWLYFPTIKIRPVVHEKQLSGSQIRISIRITPNFELGLPMIITYLLTKFHQNPTSRFWEILLTNKQTNRHTKVIAISRFSRDNKRSQIFSSRFKLPVKHHNWHMLLVPNYEDLSSD